VKILCRPLVYDYYLDEHKQVETISHANSESGVPMEEEAVEDEEETEDMTTGAHPSTIP
jgi:hypothetical protein